MRVLLFEARLIVVLIAGVMHQIQLVHQAAGLEQLKRPVDRYAIELGIFFAGQFVETLGIEMLAGLIDEIEQNLPLAGETDATLLERSTGGIERRSRGREGTFELLRLLPTQQRKWCQRGRVSRSPAERG